MTRALILTTLLLAAARPFADQAQSTLQIKVVLFDSEQKPTAVPRHALLISDNPPTAAPRRVLTRPDGTVTVTLRPGLYSVESDRPVAFNGKAYQWSAMVEVPVGGTASLELTQANAEVEAVSASTTSSAPVENDPSFLLTRWQDSVFAVWTATARTSGFAIDIRGLVVTNQRALGDDVSAEVQLGPALKVAARVVVADAARDVAVLRVDPSVLKSIKPIAPECAAPPPVADEQEIFTIGAPLRGTRNLIAGRVMRILKPVLADFRLDFDSAGGPVFTTAGAVAGLTSMTVDPEGRMDEVRLVGAADVCEVLGSVEGKMTATSVPSGAPLPIEPVTPFPASALDEAANRRVSVSIPYQMSSSDFDIAFITPVLAHAAERRWQQSTGRTSATARAFDAAEERSRLLTEFGHWSTYFEDFPPVLLVRVTPKLVEGFWTKVARGAAATQGMALPPIKRISSGFSRLRVFCGSNEVTPIHPFKLAHRINERDVAHEGLYVFDPGALGPHCGSVKLMLHSEKEPETADTRTVDPKLVELFWEDFAGYR